MGSKPRYTTAQMVEALNRTKGMVYLAARALSCSHTTIYNYARRHPTVQKAIDANRGEVIDVAELKLYEAIRAGEHWAVTFALKTIGKHRGYTERTELKIEVKQLESAIERELARVAGGGKAEIPAEVAGDADAKALADSISQ